MRRGSWLVIVFVMMLAFMVLMASCSRNVVQTEPVSITKHEIEESQETSSEKSEPAGGIEEDQLWAEVAAREAAEKSFIGENVHFAFDSAIVSDHAQQILNGKADYLRSNPAITITVEGHCDDRGSDAYNIALGKRRAESVKSFLVDLGISANRLNTVSYGEERPIAREDNEASWAKNRRAQFVIN